MNWIKWQIQCNDFHLFTKLDEFDWNVTSMTIQQQQFKLFFEMFCVMMKHGFQLMNNDVCINSPIEIDLQNDWFICNYI